MKQQQPKIHMQVRLTPREYDHLKKQSQLCGLKMEPYIKRLIMGKEVHPLPSDSHKQLARELSAIGNNVNQIARIANSTKSISQAAIQDILQQLNKLWDAYYGDH